MGSSDQEGVKAWTDVPPSAWFTPEGVECWRESTPSAPAKGDQKIKTATGKVPLNLIPLSALKGAARVFGYGVRKYAPGNFHTADDSEIANRYVGGFLRHLADCQRPDGLFDWESVAALDKESGLPELDHAICGLIMLRALAVKHGALPADPGEGNDP